MIIKNKQKIINNYSKINNKILLPIIKNWIKIFKNI